MMDASKLAAVMLEWEETQRKADALKAQIEDAVLEIGKTQTVGNVRASYSAGRKSYDYEAAWSAAVAENRVTAEDLKDFGRVSYDYRNACKAFGYEAPFTQSEPRVTVKLVG